MRAPLHKIADHFEENRPKLAKALKNFAEFIPKGVSGVNLVLRVPTAVAALTGQQWILLGAVASWGASDILLGNLQKTIGGLVDQAKQTPLIHHITERLHRRRGTKPASTALPTSALDNPAQDPAFFSTEKSKKEIPSPASDNGKRGNPKKPPGI